MERLTYDFVIGNRHCWQVKGADNLLCNEVCKAQGDNGCEECPIAKAFERLAAYENTGLEPEEILKATATDMSPVKHGRWILEKEGFWYCSECGRKVFSPKFSPSFIHYPDCKLYCPECGAKMDLPEESLERRKSNA